MVDKIKVTQEEHPCPEQLMNVFKQATANYESVEDALTWVMKEWDKYERTNKLAKEFTRFLKENFARDMIHDFRHRSNVSAKREAGLYGTKQKPKSSSMGEAVTEVADRLMDMKIGGLRLGSVYGDRLEDLASREENCGNGHLRNAALCRKLVAHVPSDRRVEDCVKENQLKAIWLQCQKLRAVV